MKGNNKIESCQENVELSYFHSTRNILGWVTNGPNGSKEQTEGENTLVVFWNPYSVYVYSLMTTHIQIDLTLHLPKAEMAEALPQ